MLWVLIEVGVALSLAGLIVWLTMGAKRVPRPDAEKEPTDNPKN